LLLLKKPVTLTAEGLVTGRTRKTARQFPSKSVKQPKDGAGMTIARPGDLLRVQLCTETARQSPSVWIRVERCDDEHRIVYGTIDDESAGLGRALGRGAKLAASYHQVQENAQIVGLGRTSSTDPSSK
jgi:hypothetical protein